MIDFGKISNSGDSTQIYPRDIFMSLPSRDKQYEYPRDVQSEVWKKWFDQRDKKNNIIKMNTGSGKTIVGLVILKSCLNEGKGPAVYVVPDDTLSNQVISEAKRLGILVTTDRTDLEFLTKKAILITTIQKLINGLSAFGMRPRNNIKIGSIIIDDIHACLATIENQFAITIPADHELYQKLVSMFESSMRSQSQSKYSDIVENSDPYTYMLIPFWDWQHKYKDVEALLNEYYEFDNVKFHYPLLESCFSICNCIITSKKVEITPKCIPIHCIKSLIQADRRIYMSATLADDSAFIYALDIDSTEIEDAISPEKANDIGDRLIIFPQVINKRVTDDEIRSNLKDLSKDYNVVVLVPFRYRLRFWESVADQVLDVTLNNVDEGIEKLKRGHVGLTVILNKYDGIDLPEDACRVLVIDGSPRLWNEYDIFEQNALPKSTRICSEQIQKIEQGMGRGVRSNTDYCVIVLMGKGLADIIFGEDGYSYFSDATKKQFELSNQLWEQIRNKSIEEIMNVAKYCLFRDVNWITISKNYLSSISYSTKTHFNSVTISIRKAFNLAESSRFADAVTVLTSEKSTTKDIYLRGLLKQHIAEYTNFFNQEQAQQLVLSAYSDNSALLKPIQGIQFEKVLNRTQVQAQNFVNYISEHQINPNAYILKVNALLEKLSFIPETANQFESALEEISFLIGIYSNRPENDYGKGPDNFWDIGNSAFLIIECKNGTTTQLISKHDCNQLNGSINWFENLYRDNSCTGYPIMIHNSDLFDSACSPNEKIKIMTPNLLDRFKSSITNFAVSAVQPEIFNNQVQINQLLVQHKLLGRDIVSYYTKDFRVAR